MDTDLSSYIKNKALKDGALLVGYTKIRRTEPVIVLGFPFTNKWFLKHPLNVTKILGREYSVSRNVHKNITKTLKDQGYITHEKTVFSIYGDFRPLAVSAGLGEWGRNGIVVNREHGCGLLFSAIFTNAPLEFNEKEQNLYKHCSNCGQCIQACPAKAFERDLFNVSRCLPQTLRGCAECLKMCHK